MRLFLRYTAFVSVLVLVHITLFAQSFSTYDSPDPSANPEKKKSNGSLAGTWEAGAMIGPDFYYGDLNSSKFLPKSSVSAAGGGYIMKQFTNVVGLKAQLLFGGLQGSAQKDKEYGLGTYAFNGTFFDLTANAVFNFSNIFSPYHSGRRFFVYGTIGLGLNAWNTTFAVQQSGGTYIPDQPVGFQASLVLPVGLGMQYAITPKISAGVEYTFRPILSDQVDHYAGGFKYDIVNLLAFSVAYRFGLAKKNLAVQEYPYSAPVRYQPQAPPEPPMPVRPGQEIPVPSAPASEVYDYVIQICAFAKHDYTVSWVKKHYHVALPVIRENENGLNRYIIGHYYKDLNVAKELCDRLRKQGIRDAWVIAYQNGIRHHVVIY